MGWTFPKSWKKTNSILTKWYDVSILFEVNDSWQQKEVTPVLTFVSIGWVYPSFFWKTNHILWNWECITNFASKKNISIVFTTNLPFRLSVQKIFNDCDRNTPQRGTHVAPGKFRIHDPHQELQNTTTATIIGFCKLQTEQSIQRSLMFYPNTGNEMRWKKKEKLQIFELSIIISTYTLENYDGTLKYT